MAATRSPSRVSIERRSEQLVDATAARSYDPLVDIDWSTPIDDSAMHMPERYLPLYATEVWERMSTLERRRYSRHECAVVMSNGIFFENVLMASVLRQLYRLPPDSPELRYLLIEVAEECRHSWMFAEYIRRAGTPAYPQSHSLYWLGSLVKGAFEPVASFVAILGAEELTDFSNRGMVEDGIHPVVRRIMQIHVEEEARHISFARTFLEHRWPQVSRVRRALVSFQALLAVRAIAGATVNTGVYRTLGIEGGARLARRNPHHRARVIEGLRRCTSFLERLGVINSTTRPAWARFGLVET